MFTYATICTGGRGGSLGLDAAGGQELWGVEYDPAIATVATLNGGTGILVADMRAVDYAVLPIPDLVLATPDCTRASQANPNAGETEEDLSRADAVVRALVALAPRMFLLENVWGYTHFESFKRICAELERQGYWWDYTHVNSADYGVPQTRKRLILRAVRDRWLPPLPLPVPWVGWYAAIADLIPTLPPDTLAPWQLARLPADLGGDTLVLPSNINTRSRFTRAAAEPAATVVAAPLTQLPIRALLIDCTHRTGGDLTTRSADEPAHTITATALRRAANAPRALLLDGANANDPRKDGDPAFTITPSSIRGRAVLVSGADATVRDADEPAVTITSTQGQGSIAHRAVLINGCNAGRDLTVLPGDKPAFTVSAQRASKQAMRAWLGQARIVRLTPRALARFQSFPDSYRLPENLTLACRIIGGAVPPLLIQRIVESLLP